MVRQVNTLDEFNRVLQESGNKLVVVDFTATWCGPCRMISPKFDHLSTLPENSNVVFLKVDVDEADDISQNCGISCMPTFQFYKGGKKVAEFSGADENNLKKHLQELRN